MADISETPVPPVQEEKIEKAPAAR